MTDQLTMARRHYQSGELEEGIQKLDELLLNDAVHVEALLLKAQILYRQQQWGAALNTLNMLLEKVPQHQEALNYRQMVMDILGFWHKDHYNP